MVDPAEHGGLLPALAAYVRGDDGGLQPLHRIPKLGVILATGRAPNGFEQVVRLKLQLARDIVGAAVLHVAKDRGRPDENIGVPNGRHAVVLVRLDGDKDPVILIDVLDGLHSLGFGEREERTFHRVFLVTEL